MLKTDLKTIFLKINFGVIFGLVVLLFGFDFIDKLEIFYGIDFPKFNRYIKLGAGLYAIGFIILNLAYLIKNLKYLIVTSVTLASIFAVKYNFWYLYAEEFLRYSFILILFPVLHFSFHYSKHQEFLRLFYWVMKIFVSVNLLVILTGIVFDIEVFHTYQYGRSGYNGLLLSQGLTPYVYMSATVLFWDKKDYVMLTLVMIASILSGIKGVYLGEFILVALLLYFSKSISNTNKLRFGIVSLVVFILVTTIIFTTSKFQQVIEEDGILSAIFSYRTDNLMEIIETSPKDSYNYFIGVIGLETVRLEMQLIDILMFFGILGFLVFIYFMHAVYIDIVKSKNSKAFFIAALSLSLLSGNLFYIPMSILLFFLTLFCLNQKATQIDSILR
ncbi:MAG: hypothetical protein ACSHXF_02695 [Aquaticitalea sp.]